MEPNLKIYIDLKLGQATADNLTVFGLQVFNQAKMIKEIDSLVKLAEELNQFGKQSPDLGMFVIEYLIDCVRVITFFENYMKAELLRENICVHEISVREINVHEIGLKVEIFKKLSREQKKRPIKFKEITDVEYYKPIFYTLHSDEKISHPAIQSKTIGIETLLKEKYLKYYKLDKGIYEIIKELKDVRNQLHFRESITMKLKKDHLDGIRKVKEFVKRIESKF